MLEIAHCFTKILKLYFISEYVDLERNRKEMEREKEHFYEGLKGVLKYALI
jgi:hypothetical protein